MAISPFKHIWTEFKLARSYKDLVILGDKIQASIRMRMKRYVLAPGIPPSIQIEPTNVCNAVCLCCPRDKMFRMKGYIELPLFQKIIDDAAHLGVKHIHLYLHGEPLLHPQIVEMIAYAKRSRLSIHLDTNGMLLTKDLGEAILRCGLDIGDYLWFSILGNSPNVHEMVMKGINHDRVIKNVSDFLQSRERLKISGPVVGARFYQMKENEAEASIFEEEWKQRVDLALMAGYVSRSFARRETDSSAIPMRTRRCTVLWERMTIYWTGDVTLCCEDINAQYVLGNIRDQSIKDIWNSEKKQSFRRLLIEQRFDEMGICKYCEM
jgi:radical SAM protein with 4Fe4S-binding SPASM domain